MIFILYLQYKFKFCIKKFIYLLKNNRMKKLIKLIMVLCALTLTSFAQPYGQAMYSYPGPGPSPISNVLMSSARVTSLALTRGHLMAGYIPVTPVGSFNFCINKTGVAGGIAAPNSIQRMYTMWHDPNCIPGAPPATQILNCEGVNVVETFVSSTPNMHYAMAGTYNGGVFFATYGLNGSIGTVKSWGFPVLQSGIGRPYIVESQVTPNMYYICGEYDNTIYIIKVNASGVQQWQRNYSIGASGIFRPKSMIECPFTNDIVIVGELVDPTDNRGVDGFLLKLLPGNGNINIFKAYDTQKPNPCIHQGFTDVKPIKHWKLNSKQGYAICGWDVLHPDGSVWAIRLDLNGNIDWSTIVAPISDPYPTRAKALTVRNNQQIFITAYSQIAGVQVLKLHDNGKMFKPGFDEFVYTSPASPNPSEPINIDFQDTPTFPNNVALNVYGNSDPVNGNDLYLIRSYFNGVTMDPTAPSNCFPDQFFNALDYNPKTTVPIPPTFQVAQLLPCPFDIHVFMDIQLPPQIFCNAANINNGSNVKIFTAGVGENEIITDPVSLLPNPTSDKTLVSYILEQKGKVSIDLYNSLGQLISNIATEEKNAGSYKNEIDFEKLGLQSGIYLINLNVNGRNINVKVIYNK